MFEAAETALLITSGFHPRRLANTYDWMANFGVAKIAKMPAPEAFSFAIC